MTCDDKHLPCSVALPVAGHSRLLKMQRLQLASTLPFRKRCWQTVIKQKIANQAACLHRLGLPGVDTLHAMRDAVTSGDVKNVEAQAARYYFPTVFGADFIREENCAVNAALNYGYAVLRGAVARAFAGHGFLLSQGIHHCSELNPFNLTDDFLEPLRPVVDLQVAGMLATLSEFTATHRQQLVALLGCDVLIDGTRQSILRATEITAASFLTACRQKDPSCLKLPALLPIARHRYE